MDTPPRPPDVATPMSTKELHLPPGSAEKIVSVLNTTRRALEAIWQEVGFQQEERDRQYVDLVLAIQQICNDKIEEETELRDTFITSIQEAKETLKTNYIRLNEPMPDIAYDDEGALIDSQGLTHQLMAYESMIEKLSAKIVTQTAKLGELQQQLMSLSDDLGEPMEEQWVDVTKDLSDKRVAAYEAQVASCETKRDERMGEAAVLVQAVLDLMAEMEMKPSTDFDNQVYGSLTREGTLVSSRETSSCVGVSSAMIEKLGQRVTELETEKERRQQLLMDLGTKLTALWDLLKTPPEECAAFEETLVNGLGDETIEKGMKELARLEALKIEKMKSIIEDKRDEIRNLWEFTCTPVPEQNRFTAMHVPESGFTDDLLSQHEEEIAALNVVVEKRAPIVKLLKKYQDAIDASEELKGIMADPNRFKRRGSAGVEAKAHEARLDKVVRNRSKNTTELLKRLKDWEKTEGGPFMYEGVDALEDINEKEKQRVESTKKKKDDSSASTPSSTPAAGMSLNKSRRA